jgi:diphthamide synthase (EF-2-diphthine--ammonia ligase)
LLSFRGVDRVERMGLELCWEGTQQCCTVEDILEVVDSTGYMVAVEGDTSVSVAEEMGMDITVADMWCVLEDRIEDLEEVQVEVEEVDLEFLSQSV